MITEEEKQDIIERAVEKALLTLPEVVGNLMASRAAMTSLIEKFYDEHPEFKECKKTVAMVIEDVEGKDPTAEYQDILKRAVPEIKRRITMMTPLNTIDVPAVPKIDYKDAKINSFGEL